MAEFESFDNSKQKFRKIWEKNEENTSQIDNNLQRFEVNFSSVNFLKALATINIPVLSSNEDDTSIFVEDIDQIVTVSLNGFPEWIINHINVMPIVELVGDINDDVIRPFFSTGTLPATTKLGDISFQSTSKYWVVKLSENNYLFKIALDINIRKIISLNEPVQGNFNTEAVPFTLDLSLKIINPRIYERSNIQKT